MNRRPVVRSNRRTEIVITPKLDQYIGLMVPPGRKITFRNLFLRILLASETEKSTSVHIL